MKYIFRAADSYTTASLPVWGAWIEIAVAVVAYYVSGSLPVWGAWIEMANAKGTEVIYKVAPRVGGVD